MARDPAEFQSKVTAALLAVLGAHGFALAGSGAIRALGLTDRPTNDVDLFGPPAIAIPEFVAAADQGRRALEALGLSIETVRAETTFQRWIVTGQAGESTEVDLGVDWRGEEPITSNVGPVLALDDAVGSKIAAAFSRGEVRDFLDLDAIRQAGRFSDQELVRLAADHDPGFDPGVLAAQIEDFAAKGAAVTSKYGVSPAEQAAITARLRAWAAELR